MPVGFVEVRVETELRGVALGEKILAKNIRDQDGLIARIEFVQVRIGVLLEHVEGGEIVLPAVVVVVAENAHAEIGVVENETAKIAHERLNAEARRNEIVVVREIAEMDFGERFLERKEILLSAGAVRDSDRADRDRAHSLPAPRCSCSCKRRGNGCAQSTGLNAVSPLNRSMPIWKSFEKKTCSLRPKNSELFGRAVLTPLGVGRLRVLRTARNRHGQVEKNILADDRRVAFELALQIRVPQLQIPALIRRLRRRIGVTFPAAEPDEPAVRHRLDRAPGSRGPLPIPDIPHSRSLRSPRNDFAHAFARQAQRTRQRFAPVLGQLRQDRRKQIRRRLRFLRFLAAAGIGIELVRRQAAARPAAPPGRRSSTRCCWPSAQSTCWPNAVEKINDAATTPRRLDQQRIGGRMRKRVALVQGGSSAPSLDLDGPTRVMLEYLNRARSARSTFRLERARFFDNAQCWSCVGWPSLSRFLFWLRVRSRNSVRPMCSRSSIRRRSGRTSLA